MKRTVFAAVLSLALATTGFAQMGGGGMGGGGMGGGMGNGGTGSGGMGGGSMAGGGGMLGVADDGSLLFVDGHGGMQWLDDEAASAELVNIDANGQERWRTTFEGGRPTMTITAGDLVVVNVKHFGEMSGSGAGTRDGMYGGMGNSSSILVGLDLVSGVQLWTFELDTPSMTRAHLSEDGSIVYVIATDAAEMGTGSMHQGDGSFARQMTSTLYALDRFGDILWTLELGDN